MGQYQEREAAGYLGALRLLAVLALALAAFLFIVALLRAQTVLSDWHAYYRAAANLRAGADLYAEGKDLLARNSYDHWVHTDGHYVYPPLLAMLLVPLAGWLDIGKGGDVWLGVLVAATLGFLWTVARLLDRPLRVETIAPLAVPVLASVPLLLGIRYGQVDIVLLLVVALALLAHQRGRDLLAGVALGVAAAVKPTLALYGLFFLRKRRWRLLSAATLTGLVLGLGPFLALGLTALTDWLAIARYFSGEDYPTYPSNQSVRGLLLRAFVGGPRHVALLESRWLADGLWLVAIVGVGLLWWRCVAPEPSAGGRAAAEYGLTATAILLLAPLSEDIHYVMLLLPLAVLADRAAWGPAVGGRWSLLVIAGCLYFLQPWLDFAYNRGSTDLRRLIASGAYLYGLLPVGAALVLVLWRRSGERGHRGGARDAESGMLLSGQATRPVPREGER